MVLQLHIGTESTFNIQVDFLGACDVKSSVICMTREGGQRLSSLRANKTVKSSSFYNRR